MPSLPARHLLAPTRATNVARRSLATSARPAQSSSPRPSRPKRLPEPHATWRWEATELAQAVDNARLRNFPTDQQGLTQLHAELRPRFVAANDAVARLGTRARQIEAELRAASAGSSDSKDDQARIASLRADIRRTRDEAKAEADVAERIASRSLQLRLKLPNRTHPDVPEGTEANARVVRIAGPLHLLPRPHRGQVVKLGTSPTDLAVSAFPASPPPDPSRDHQRLAVEGLAGALDPTLDRLASGPNWPFLVGTLANLEHALSHYALRVAQEHGFVPVVVPDVVRTELAERCGFAPRDSGGAAQTYFVTTDNDKRTTTVSTPQDSEAASTSPHDDEGGEDDVPELCLAGTAEIPLAALCAGRTLRRKAKAAVSESSSSSAASVARPDASAADVLPHAYVALSHAFRAEAGARGADTRGLYRVHQFSKVEMFVVCAPDDGEAWLERLRALQERIVAALLVPSRTLDMPTHELGASAYRKYDVEVWMPGRGSWGEVSSASLCTDYQAARLGIRYKDAEGGGGGYAHTLNATAAAVPRLIVSILENHGLTPDGRPRLPAALRPHWLPGPTDAAVHWIEGTEEEELDPPPSPALGRAEAEPTSKRRVSAGRAGVVSAALERVRDAARSRGTDPASMVVAFLVLHELTALVPLLVAFFVLNALGAGEAMLRWLLPDDGRGEGAGGEPEGGTGQAVTTGGVQGSWAGEKLSAWVREGLTRAERYGRRKGWWGLDSDDSQGGGGGGGSRAGVEAGEDAAAAAANLAPAKLAGGLADAVAAYVIVKALLPVRIGASIALSAPLARLCIEPLKRAARRLRGKRRPPSPPTQPSSTT